MKKTVPLRYPLGVQKEVAADPYFPMGGKIP